MNGKTKSILLQVAMKLAVESTSAQGLYDNESVKTRTKDFYAMLGGLHAELGIDADEGRGRGGNGGGGSTRKPLPESVTTFTSEGVEWYDFRKAKDNKDVAAGHPEFKTTDFKESVWMYEKDGSPKPEAAVLVTAADGVAAF